MNRYFLAYLIWTVSLCITYAQTDKNKIQLASIGFYNLENLYDTVDDTLINDEEFLPQGTKAWTPERYAEKLKNMALVISQIGTTENLHGLSLLGVAEIENKRVLLDLVKEPQLKAHNYKVIQFDSPDLRGVDVGLLYNPRHFTPLHAQPITIYNYDGDSRRYTRDILYVKGLFGSDSLHVMVNHWPSRSGGEARSAPFRNNAARMCRMVVDSLIAIDPMAKIVIMGDLNDDPTSESMKSFLRCVGNVDDVERTSMFNPFEDLYRRGQGSNAFQDTWSLFDQIVISRGLVQSTKGYKYNKAAVYNKQFLVQPTGQYKGYPFRTFSGDTFQSGYSDHFPTYIYLTKEVASKN
jgi:hypothetical protein